MKQQEQAAEPSLKQSCKFQSDMNYTQIMQVTERVCKCKTQRRALVVYKKLPVSPAACPRALCSTWQQQPSIASLLRQAKSKEFGAG